MQPSPFEQQPLSLGIDPSAFSSYLRPAGQPQAPSPQPVAQAYQQMQQEAPQAPAMTPAPPMQAPTQQQVQAPMNGYEEYENARNEILRYRSRVLGNAINMSANMAPEQGKYFQSSVKEKLDADYPLADLERFEKTEQYQIAKDEAKELRQKAGPMFQLGNQLKKVQDLLDTGNPADRETAVDMIKMGSLKAINSLVSPDAVSVGEAMLRYRSIIDAFEINALQNAGVAALKGFVLKLNDVKPEKLQAEWDKYKSGQTSLFDTAKNALKEVASADPERFHASATSIYNSVAEPYNQHVKSIEARTSPMHLKNHFGLEPTMAFRPRVDNAATTTAAPAAPPTVMGGGSMVNTGSRDISSQGAPAVVAPAQPQQRRVFGNTKFSVLNP